MSPPTGPAFAAASARSAGRSVTDRLTDSGITIPLLVMVIVFASTTNGFLHTTNLKSIAFACGYLGIVAVGQTILLVTGQFDLSVGSVAGMGSAVAAELMSSRHWNPITAVAVALTLGAIVGLVNGLLVVRVGLPAFIVTLGMLFVARGAALVIANGQPIYPLPRSFTSFGSARPFGLQSAVWIFIAVAVLGDLILRGTLWGRRVYVTGDNAEAATLSGINAGRVRIVAFVASGVLSVLAGVLVVATIGRGQGDIGTGWELSVIAAVVVGGVSLFGGSGTVARGVLGLLFLQIVANGLVLANLDSSLQPVATGAIMIVAVAVSLLRRGRASSGGG